MQTIGNAPLEQATIVLYTQYPGAVWSIKIQLAGSRQIECHANFGLPGARNPWTPHVENMQVKSDPVDVSCSRRSAIQAMHLPCWVQILLRKPTHGERSVCISGCWMCAGLFSLYSMRRR